jgi:recombinational DNA repair ATPase RecF
MVRIGSNFRLTGLDHQDANEQNWIVTVICVVFLLVAPHDSALFVNAHSSRRVQVNLQIFQRSPELSAKLKESHRQRCEKSPCSRT